jgi:ATP-dependent Lhr-like helicase
MASQGWTPLPFQRTVWDAYAAGKSGLIYSSTGTGKTYAAWLGFVSEASTAPGLKALWITPLRALAEDTTMALNRPLEALDIPWRVEQRTGDTSASAKQRQIRTAPGGLVTTPESLSLLLTQKDAQKLLSNLQLVVVDEWHELMGTKRGTQTELGLARLRAWNPGLSVWALSATMGNTLDAAQELGLTELIAGEQEKKIVVDSILPLKMERFPWAGHLGTQMMPLVAQELSECQSALVFTNTRGQAEIWYQALLMLLPEIADQIALHHGSLDRADREVAENGLRDGSIRAVVSTSSLDLGVDFSPVERVFQIGSPKGVARLMQRAGRSGHQPGEASRITIVPTNGMELMEIAALRDAVNEKRIEARIPPRRPLDVLVQHLVTIALGGGFEAVEFRKEVMTAHAFRDLTDREWEWCLDFVTQGGESLKAYPNYHKVRLVQGRYIVDDKRIAMQHRLSIGTIVSEASVRVSYLKGPTLGTVEESFAGRLRKGDRFVFAGRPLEFVMLKDLTCYVRRASSSKGRIVRWSGSRMSLSVELADGLRRKLDEAASYIFEDSEMQAARGMLSVQQDWSKVPCANEVLIEMIETREGHHLFCYALEGRTVHEGLAALLAHRLSRIKPMTFTFAANDYGLELLSDDEIPFSKDVVFELFTVDNLAEDLVSSMNAAELSKRQFREIARVAGLVFSGYPGTPKSTKQVQATSGLIYDVFAKYEPSNPLLGQAGREVMDLQLDQSRLTACLRRILNSTVIVSHPERPTPFAFPLMVDRLRETVSSEEVEDRVRKMIAALESQAS